MTLVLFGAMVSAAWGLFYVEISIEYLRADATKGVADMGSQYIHILKVGYVASALFHIIALVGVSGDLERSIFRLKDALSRLLGQERTFGSFKWHVMDTTVHALRSLAIFLLVFAFWTWILAAGLLVFDTHGQINGYHVALSSALFLVIYFLLMRHGLRFRNETSPIDQTKRRQ